MIWGYSRNLDCNTLGGVAFAQEITTPMMTHYTSQGRNAKLFAGIFLAENIAYLFTKTPVRERFVKDVVVRSINWLF